MCVCRTERLRGALTCYAIQNVCIAVSAAAAAALVLLNVAEQGPSQHPVSKGSSTHTERLNQARTVYCQLPDATQQQACVTASCGKQGLVWMHAASAESLRSPVHTRQYVLRFSSTVPDAVERFRVADEAVTSYPWPYCEGLAGIHTEGDWGCVCCCSLLLQLCHRGPCPLFMALYWCLTCIMLLAGASSSIGSLGAAVAVEREYAKTLCGDDSSALRKLNASE
jgi:hypothetical protein